MNKSLSDQQSHQTHLHRSQDYSAIVQLTSEPEEVDSEEFCKKQPVQHPAGNGTPTHFPSSTEADGIGLAGLHAAHVPEHLHYGMENRSYGNRQCSMPSQLYPTPEETAPSFAVSTLSGYSMMSDPNGNAPVRHYVSQPQQHQWEPQACCHNMGRSASYPNGYCHDCQVYKRSHPATLQSDFNRASSLNSGGHRCASNGHSHERNRNSDGGLSSMARLHHSLPESNTPKPMSQNKRLSSESDNSSDYSFTTMNPTYENPDESTHGDRSNQTRHPGTPPANRNAHSDREQPPGNNHVVPRTSSTHPFPPNSNSSGRTSSQRPEAKASVFITYANEVDDPNDQHIRTVVQISQTLRKNSIDISVDMLEEQVQSLSVSDWLEEKLTSCTFVLICISPSYRKMVEEECETSSIDRRTKERSLHTKYIYRRLHTEYINQGSKNFRYIPVLMSGADEKHIPTWLRDTKVYQWPDDYENIIFRLYRIEKYVKPPLGQPPRHSVEQYGTSMPVRSDSSRNRGRVSLKSLMK